MAASNIYPSSLSIIFLFLESATDYVAAVSRVSYEIADVA